LFPNIDLEHDYEGIAGNIFSLFAAPNVVSVGNGGCILGLVGAGIIELVFSLLMPPKTTTASNRTNPVSDIEDDDTSYDSGLECADSEIGSHLFIFLLGILSGMGLMTIFSHIFSGAIEMKRDWTTLYGGLLGGLIIGSIIFVPSKLHSWSTMQVMICMTISVTIPLLEFIMSSGILESQHQILNESLRNLCAIIKERHDDYRCAYGGS